MKTRHAEVDVIEKIKSLYSKKEKKNHKKLKKLNMLVFRTNKKGDSIMNAKPCQNCLNYMKNIYKKGYKIQKIYYTDENSEIQVV